MQSQKQPTQEPELSQVDKYVRANYKSYAQAELAIYSKPKHFEIYKHPHAGPLILSRAILS